MNLAEILAQFGGSTDDYYAAVRSTVGLTAAFRDSELDAMVLVSYAACREALTAPELGKARLRLPTEDLSESAQGVVRDAEAMMRRQMIFKDPLHTRTTRRYWKAALGSAHKAEDKRDAHKLLTAPAGMEFDLYNDLLIPYVSFEISRALRIDESDRAGLYPFIERYVRYFDGKALTSKDVLAAARSALVIEEYVKSRYADLVHCIGRGSTDFAPDDWISDYIIVLVAGHESSAYLVAVAIWQLLVAKDPRLWALARTSPETILREALRYDSPVQLIGRKAVSDWSYDRFTIPAGERVYIHVGLANRDPTAFFEPDCFNVRRHEPAPLSFGHGASACIGASFALCVAAKALVHLATWVQDYDIVGGSPQWEHGLAGRGIRAFRVCRTN